MEMPYLRRKRYKHILSKLIEQKKNHHVNKGGGLEIDDGSG